MTIKLLPLALGAAHAHVSLETPSPRTKTTDSYPGQCAQGSCFWFSQGCVIGCPTCTGRDARAQKDTCGANVKALLCDPRLRTYNKDAPCNSAQDTFKHNPWRSPGKAPTFDVWCVLNGMSWPVLPRR